MDAVQHSYFLLIFDKIHFKVKQVIVYGGSDNDIVIVCCAYGEFYYILVNLKRDICRLMDNPEDFKIVPKNSIVYTMRDGLDVTNNTVQGVLDVIYYHNSGNGTRLVDSKIYTDEELLLESLLNPPPDAKFAGKKL